LGGEPCNISLKWEARQPFNNNKLENNQEENKLNNKRGKALIHLDYEPKTRQVQFELRQMIDLPKDLTLGLPGKKLFIYFKIK
jgi:hypothetical protein